MVPIKKCSNLSCWIAAVSDLLRTGWISWHRHLHWHLRWHRHRHWVCVIHRVHLGQSDENENCERQWSTNRHETEDQEWGVDTVKGDEIFIAINVLAWSVDERQDAQDPATAQDGQHGNKMENNYGYDESFRSTGHWNNHFSLQTWWFSKRNWQNKKSGLTRWQSEYGREKMNDSFNSSLKLIQILTGGFYHLTIGTGLAAYLPNRLRKPNARSQIRRRPKLPNLWKGGWEQAAWSRGPELFWSERPSWALHGKPGEAVELGPGLGNKLAVAFVVALRCFQQLEVHD